MSSRPALRVQSLSKTFSLYQSPQDRFRLSIKRRLLKIFGMSSANAVTEYCAIKDISFEVNSGEVFGVIGSNGSGKSTLLQLICRTLNPTFGSIEVNGRVAALLELGAGFNPEFTGRDNVYLNASILGMTKSEIDLRFSKIEDFAGIGSFIDQPVKTYSSGMYIRLAFSVAINVCPDILIVDEALAVGDIHFQAKCMLKIRQMMEQGVTIVIVSHDLSAIRNLCTKVLWLDKGVCRGFGKPSEIVSEYLSSARLMSNDYIQTEYVNQHNDSTTVGERQADYAKTSKGINYGSGEVEIYDPKLINQDLNEINELNLEEKFTLQFKAKVFETIKNVAFGYAICDLKGNQIISSLTSNYKFYNFDNLVNGTNLLIEINGINTLNQGVYTVTFVVEELYERNKIHKFLHVYENAITFKVAHSSDPYKLFHSLVWHPVAFKVDLIADNGG